MKYLQNEELCKDLVMDIFEKITVDLNKHKIENFKSWFYSVVKNQCLMLLRANKSKQKHLKNIEAEQKLFMENQSYLHHTNSISTETKANYVNDAMNELKHNQANCLKLFYYEDKSYDEIADSTGFSIKQVKSYLQNGKRNLKTILQTKIQYD